MTFTNLAQMHRLQAHRLGPRVALRFKKHGWYHDLSWDAYRALVEAGAAALVEAGIRPGDRVGLVAENRLDWLIADMAILAAGAVNVPPHAPLTARQILYQLADAGVRWLFLSTSEQLEKLRPVLSELPDLEGIVVFDRFEPLVSRRILGWTAFLQKGRLLLDSLRSELARREDALGPASLATIMYTSGTTGNPKGVMLSHGNLLSNALAMAQASPPVPQAVLLSWLPFSHIYSRTVDHYFSQVTAVPLALAESPETVVQNLAEVRPTNMSSVPRFYEKVLAAVASAHPDESGRRLREIFGGRIDWLGSGGAPLPLPVALAYQKAGLLLLQGYGLTESSPVISFNRKDKYKLSSVGQPIPGVEVKIAADGEVLTRGPHVMQGYWNDPAATADAVKEGWLHTGDLGEIDADGFLSITGRKKELLVLSNGKKVAPAYLEGLLLSDPCIDQCVIHGEGRNFLTALVVPNWANLRRLMQAEGSAVPAGDEAALSRDPRVCAFISQRMEKCLADVASWEQVKKCLVLPRPFTVAAEELTVSLKLRRREIFAHYQAELDSLYRSAEPGV